MYHLTSLTLSLWCMTMVSSIIGVRKLRNINSSNSIFMDSCFLTPKRPPAPCKAYNSILLFLFSACYFSVSRYSLQTHTVYVVRLWWAFLLLYCLLLGSGFPWALMFTVLGGVMCCVCGSGMVRGPCALHTSSHTPSLLPYHWGKCPSPAGCCHSPLRRYCCWSGWLPLVIQSTDVGTGEQSFVAKTPLFHFVLCS